MEGQCPSKRVSHVLICNLKYRIYIAYQIRAVHIRIIDYSVNSVITSICPTNSIAEKNMIIK